MAQRYPHVFSPISIGRVELRNRIYMPAHGLMFISGGPNGSRVPSQDCVHYYAERAAGGVALMLHSLCVDPRGMLACAYYEDSIPAFQAVAEGVHEHGGKMFGQLHIYPNQKNSWVPLSPGAPVMSASAQSEFDFHFTYREMTEKDIAGVTNLHVQAAANLAAAGYDGIEIHASHGMLSEQFLSPYYNKRTDAYGGDVAGRAKFVTDILRQVREAVGPDKAVGMRYVCDEMLPGGLTTDLAREMLEHISSLGLIDFVNLDISVEPRQGDYMTMPQHVPQLYTNEFIEAVAPGAGKNVVVMGVPGRLNVIAQAEELLAKGHMQMVGCVRALMAEPHLVKHAAEGHEEESRRCTSGNFCASERSFPGFGCQINPATGRERIWGTENATLAPKRGTVVVVGGGPAGLEAARIAAFRGHHVVLFEQKAALGGQLALWASLPGRAAWTWTTSWYQRRLPILGVEVRTGSTATAAEVLALEPQAIIIATGARYVPGGESSFLAQKVRGAELPFVYTPEQILEDGARPTGHVLVLDDEGIATAPGIAELLAEGGAQVELISREFEPMKFLNGQREATFILPKLHKLGVKITPKTYIREISPGKAIVYDVFTDAEEERDIDAVVLATMRRSVGLDLVRELEGSAEQVFVIGDAASPRALPDVMYEGQKFARLIGEPGAPKDFTEAWFSPPEPEVFVGFAPAQPRAATHT